MFMSENSHVIEGFFTGRMSREAMDDVPELPWSAVKCSGGAWGTSCVPRTHQGFQSPAYDPIGTFAIIYNSYLIWTENQTNWLRKRQAHTK